LCICCLWRGCFPSCQLLLKGEHAPSANNPSLTVCGQDAPCALLSNKRAVLHPVSFFQRVSTLTSPQTSHLLNTDKMQCLQCSRWHFSVNTTVRTVLLLKPTQLRRIEQTLHCFALRTCFVATWPECMAVQGCLPNEQSSGKWCICCPWRGFCSYCWLL